ncbi:hypothetical protein ACP70R_018171 [Stipagrostis hirtigluma subsp. patula]
MIALFIGSVALLLLTALALMAYVHVPLVTADSITVVCIMDSSTRQSILNGKQMPGSYEEPVGGTLTSVTIKLLQDACKQTTEGGRPIMHGFVLSTVRLVGKIIRQEDSSESIDFDFTDFTGTVNCIIWDCEDNDLSMKMLRCNEEFYYMLTGAPMFTNEKCRITAYDLKYDPSLQDIMNRESVSSTTKTGPCSATVYDNVLYFIKEATPT